MKRYLTCLCALLLVSTFGAVKAMGETEIAVGPKAGLNIATMTGNLVDTLAAGATPDAGYMVRGVVGVFVAFTLSDKWAIQPEVLYAQKAGKWELVNTQGVITATTSQKIELEYVEIPVLLKFTILQTGKLQPFLYAGPAIAVRAASSVKLEAIADSSGTKIRHDTYYSSNIHNAKSTITEVIMGAGFEWKLGSTRLTFEGRYTRSFGTLFDDVTDFDAVPEDDAFVARYPSGEALKLNHSVFSFVIGYAFSL